MTQSKLAWLAALTSVAFGTQVACGQSQSAANPDNTGANAQNSSTMARTADQQAENAGDLDLTKRIRQSVLADKTLSTYAHNVKIVSVNGTVTLDGVVRSDHEKREIESKAQRIAGKDRVVDQMQVAPNH